MTSPDVPSKNSRMAARSGAVHVATTKRVYKGKTYVTHLLRRSIRKGKTVTHETLGNLSHLPDHLIDLIKRSLKGETFVPAAEAFRITRSLPHGHVEAVLTMIRKLGLDDLIASEPSRRRDLVVAMIAERLLFPSSKLANTRHWHDTTLAEELDVADATEDELYDAMDWLLERQAAIEKKLAKRHLSDGALVLYDVTSSYYEGKTCPLARFGHDRDGKTGCPIIVYGVLTDADGRPVAVQVYPGNTGDPKTVPDQVETLTKRFGLSRVVLVGDRGMLTQTQIDVLKKHPGLGWISALRSGVDPPPAGRRPPDQERTWRPNAWRRSRRRNSPANGWWPATTRSWPSSGGRSARSCWRPRRPNWRRWPRAWRGRRAGPRRRPRSA